MTRSRALTLIVVLLLADVVLRVVDRVVLCLPVSRAQAQAAAQPAEKVAIATAQGPAGHPWCYVYDLESQRLAVYETGNQGIELKGVRHLIYDLKLVELRDAPCNQRFTVKQVKDLVK